MGSHPLALRSGRPPYRGHRAPPQRRCEAGAYGHLGLAASRQFAGSTPARDGRQLLLGDVGVRLALVLWYGGGLRLVLVTLRGVAAQLPRGTPAATAEWDPHSVRTAT